MTTSEQEFIEEFHTLFFRLYRDGCIETKASRENREITVKTLVFPEKIREELGKETADSLRSAINIAREDEGLRLFLEGFRCGMALVSNSL